jgi:hypothetical protein
LRQRTLTDEAERRVFPCRSRADSLAGLGDREGRDCYTWQLIAADRGRSGRYETSAWTTAPKIVRATTRGLMPRKRPRPDRRRDAPGHQQLNATEHDTHPDRTGPGEHRDARKSGHGQ